MPKLLLKIDLESSEEKFSYKVNGYIKDNTIYYIGEDKVKTSYDYKNDILTRESEEYIMEYIFDKDNSFVSIKDKKLLNKFRLGLTDILIKKANHNLELEYKIEENKIKYKIEVENEYN